MMMMIIILNIVDVLAVTPPAAYDISQKSYTESVLSYALSIGGVIKSFSAITGILTGPAGEFSGPQQSPA